MAISKVGRFLSVRSVGLATVAAVVGCAACCAIPMIAAAGLGGGAMAALANLMWPGAEFALGGMAFVGVIGVAAARRRSAKQDSCTTSCSVADTPAEGGCGCGPRAASGVQIYGSPTADEHEPVACTFDFKNMAHAQAHMDSYRVAFTRLVATERFSGGFRWKFLAQPGFDNQLKTLAESEKECCRFLDFDIGTDGQHIIWETRAHAHAAAFLEEYLQLPERLCAEPRPGHDMEAVEKGVREAGLVFTNPLGRTGNR